MTHISQNIPIVVVNLERSKDRRAFMEQQLQRFGVAYDIFPAVDGHHLSKSDQALYSEEKARREKRPMASTEIGCALSHIRIYEKIVGEKIPEMLILEDDVAIHKDFFPILFQREKWAPKNWKIIHFYSQPISKSHAKSIPYNMSCHYYIDSKEIYSLCKYTHSHARTMAYVVKLEACRRLLKNAYPIHKVADRLMGSWSYKRLPTYTIWPQICVHKPNNKSTIVNHEVMHLNKMLNTKLLKTKKKSIITKSIHFLSLGRFRVKANKLRFRLFIKYVWKRQLIDLPEKFYNTETKA